MPRGTAARPAVATDAAVGPGPHTAVAAGHTPGRAAAVVVHGPASSDVD